MKLFYRHSLTKRIIHSPSSRPIEQATASLSLSTHRPSQPVPPTEHTQHTFDPSRSPSKYAFHPTEMCKWDTKPLRWTLCGCPQAAGGVVWCRKAQDRYAVTTLHPECPPPPESRVQEYCPAHGGAQRARREAKERKEQEKNLKQMEQGLEKMLKVVRKERERLKQEPLRPEK